MYLHYCLLFFITIFYLLLFIIITNIVFRNKMIDFCPSKLKLIVETYGQVGVILR